MTGPPPIDRDLGLILAGVTDPEIPVLPITDLGIVRQAFWEDATAVVVITPTYSGCPAMDVIRSDIASAMEAAGVPAVDIRTVYAPAWTTDWISQAGLELLAGAGIAPPRQPADAADQPVLCVQCASPETRTVSEFGSTACKALHVCMACGEPFDRFKEL